MARIFITGSSTGLGELTAKALIQQGHKVVLHARNKERSREALRKNPEAETVLAGDLTNIDETKDLAHKVNESGLFDAVIHNAGVYQVSAKETFAVNTLAPYILTSLIQKPKRLIYLTSGMHIGGHFKPEDFKAENTPITYSDSKLHVVMLSNAIARKWPGVFSNAVNPGWVPTRMGGAGAPDDIHKGYETQVWLAVSNDTEAKVSGRYFFHQHTRDCNPEALNTAFQDEFISLCQHITGVPFPS